MPVPTAEEICRSDIENLTGSGVDPALSETQLDRLVQLAERTDGTYDPYRAAIIGLEWKKAAIANRVNFSTDGNTINAADQTANLDKLIADYRRKVTGAPRLPNRDGNVIDPSDPTDLTWVLP